MDIVLLYNILYYYYIIMYNIIVLKFSSTNPILIYKPLSIQALLNAVPTFDVLFLNFILKIFTKFLIFQPDKLFSSKFIYLIWYKKKKINLYNIIMHF